MPQHDCLIIGGGVIGLSLAYELSSHGLRVRVLDRATPIGQASWAGAGILPPPGSLAIHDPVERLRVLAHELHRRWSLSLREETGIDNGFRRCGGLYLARNPGETAALRALVKQYQQDGVIVETLSPEQVAQVEPALAHLCAADRLRAAFRLPDEAQLRNPRHLRALRLAAERRGVEFSDDTEFRAFKRAGDRIEAVETTNGRLPARCFCVCTGVWTSQLLAPLGLELAIEPIRGQMVMWNAGRQLFSHILNDGLRYLVPRDDGRVLAGSTVEQVGFDCGTTPEAIDGLIRFGAGLVPELEKATVERTWAGLRPGSGDGMPWMGQAPGIANLFVSSGHFRSGLHLSPAVAVVMGQLIRGKEPKVDLTPFHLNPLFRQ